jgi:hypothetical protein
MEVEVWKLMVLRGLGFWVVIFDDEIKRLVLTTHKESIIVNYNIFYNDHY